jgi:N-acylglucosamine 2-epimerase
MDFLSLAQLYKSTLLDDVIPFWTKYSIDQQHGGYFTCLNRDGTVFDADKFVWLQARQVWTFSMLYNQLEQSEEWLEIAQHGADFLRRYGMDEGGNWYFALDSTGRPLVQPYNIFSDCFACMAFAQYALASGDDKAAELSKITFDNILRRKSNPKGIYNKLITENRPIKGFALPMILANLVLELENILPDDLVNEQINNATNEILGEFLDPKTLLICEHIALNGEQVNSFDGRLINPGHSIEAMWFLMAIGKRLQDATLIERAVDISLAALEFGWDKKHDGIFYFMDRLGHPPQQLEWDQKLWWVHMETLVALAMGYSLTRREECLSWYKVVHKYTWNHFPDPGFGEWFGYLNRQGEPLLPIKGGKWKGCYHLPRALFTCWQIFDDFSKYDDSQVVSSNLKDRK